MRRTGGEGTKGNNSSNTHPTDEQNSFFFLKKITKTINNLRPEITTERGEGKGREENVERRKIKRETKEREVRES